MAYTANKNVTQTSGVYQLYVDGIRQNNRTSHGNGIVYMEKFDTYEEAKEQIRSWIRSDESLYLDEETGIYYSASSGSERGAIDEWPVGNLDYHYSIEEKITI